jgi:hypothetical protein
MVLPVILHTLKRNRRNCSYPFKESLSHDGLLRQQYINCVSVVVFLFSLKYMRLLMKSMQIRGERLPVRCLTGREGKVGKG